MALSPRLLICDKPAAKIDVLNCEIQLIRSVEPLIVVARFPETCVSPGVNEDSENPDDGIRSAIR